jgi:AcrR family transcriptional regulator
VANRPSAKLNGKYHHGDLQRSLVEAAIETIRSEGLEALTLRSVGAKVGVSRTALYRHFESKAALLARVAADGFRLLHATLTQVIANSPPEAADTLQVLAAAHVAFALANPSYYQTMFGGVIRGWRGYPELVQWAGASLDLVAEVVRDAQRRGRIGPHDPMDVAEIFWSLSHGLATLGSFGHLSRTPLSVEELAVLGSGLLERGLRP